ncbi:hypothetical protein ADINL_0042 [Nitrincola lacisaponensis]|uniref:Uncharacterized protein n=1 Tax=Nitrincola lacisaponensis TaxID=267850 RepID=A0A063YAN3_9GAMM|nr:hypothetical protein [Nitrincola lacisaponensis]KDE41362.1 hypothetical protein ADINL_0042 [Nitrincola lacisaponensis]
MTATAHQRLESLTQQLSDIAQRYDELTEQRDHAVMVGDDAQADLIADQLEQLERDRKRLAAKVAPLTDAAEKESQAALTKEGQKLAKNADAMLAEIQSVFDECQGYAEKLAAAADKLNMHSAIHWMIVAKDARQKGGKPQFATPRFNPVTLERMANIRNLLDYLNGDLSAKSVQARSND